MHRLPAFLLFLAIAAPAAPTDFNGRWDITVNEQNRKRAWWLEVIGADTPQPSGSFIGAPGGGLDKLTDLKIDKDELSFSFTRGFRYGSEPQAKQRKGAYRARVVNGKLEGTLQLEGEAEPIRFTGVRAPKFERADAGKLKPGKPIELFNGKDLTGWRPLHADRKVEWQVADGVTKNVPGAVDIVTERKFWNFKLHAEYRVGPKSNSGIGLRARYEVQILEDYGRPVSLHGNGALYSRILPSTNASRPANEWQTFDITLAGNRVTVVLNGTTIIDDKEIDGLTAVAVDPHEGEPGPIIIQGDHGAVEFRKFTLTPLSDALAAEAPAQWPQYRGPGGSGVASDAVPVEFGASKRVAWKTALPSGHSSPAIWSDRIFLTAFDAAAKKLELLCLDRKDGKILWRAAVPATEIEKVHKVSNPANATPAVDADRVYVYFGSAGLFSYDHDGKPAWSMPMPTASVMFGSGVSPVVAGDSLILLLDHGQGTRKMLVIDRKTGKLAREIDVNPAKTPGNDGHSTPVPAGDLVVIHRPGDISAWDPRDGTRKWWVNLFSQGTGTPVVTPDVVYVAAWHNIGDSDFFTPPAWEEIVKNDKDGDGLMAAAELPKDLYLVIRPDAGNVEGANINVAFALNMADGNKDGKLSKDEYEGIVKMATTMRRDHGLTAIKTGGEGDVTKSHVLWTEKKSVSEVPAPLFFRDRVYMVTNGGVVTCMDAKTGKLVYRGRLGTGGMYLASPIIAGDRVYVASADGVVSVLKPSDSLEVIARNDLGEPIYATPAVAGKTLYVRTSGHLYAFAE